MNQKPVDRFNSPYSTNKSNIVPTFYQQSVTSIFPTLFSYSPVSLTLKLQKTSPHIITALQYGRNDGMTHLNAGEPCTLASMSLPEDSVLLPLLIPNPAVNSRNGQESQHTHVSMPGFQKDLITLIERVESALKQRKDLEQTLQFHKEGSWVPFYQKAPKNWTWRKTSEEVPSEANQPNVILATIANIFHIILSVFYQIRMFVLYLIDPQVTKSSNFSQSMESQEIMKELNRSVNENTLLSLLHTVAVVFGNVSRYVKQGAVNDAREFEHNSLRMIDSMQARRRRNVVFFFVFLFACFKKRKIITWKLWTLSHRCIK